MRCELAFGEDLSEDESLLRTGGPDLADSRIRVPYLRHAFFEPKVGIRSSRTAFSAEFVLEGAGGYSGSAGYYGVEDIP